MGWKRLGHLFEARGQFPWMRSHAAVPIAEHVSGDVWRIYFSARDVQNRSCTGALLLDVSQRRVLDIEAQPVLQPGALGEFDDSGAMASWLCHAGGETYLYYIGWNLGRTVPFRNSIGLARRRADGRFERMYPGPIVDRSRDEPHFCASCCVWPGEAGTWRMWYLSCTGWTEAPSGPRHHYHLKYAESSDGIDWRRRGTVAIDYADASEYAISRPSVVRDGATWKMWFSHRGDAYAIGQAESEDGRVWRRAPQPVLAASGWGWDSDMVEYPFVFDHGGARYMLYNGNGYGLTGFGLAVQEP